MRVVDLEPGSIIVEERQTRPLGDLDGLIASIQDVGLLHPLKIEANYSNQFGRVRALYVVHNHDLAGGKWCKKNNILHWHAQFLQELSEIGHMGQPVHTYYNGETSPIPVPIKYYPYRHFRPLPFFLELAL